MSPLEYVLLSSGIVYLLFLISVVIGFRRSVQRLRNSVSSDQPTSSIIVPARDEEEFLERCIDSILASISGPAEILIVDDHSRDATRDISSLLETRHEVVRALTMDDEANGKTAAISHGINNSNGAVILTVDADCQVSGSWHASMLRCISDNTPMVSGAVLFPEPNSAFDSMQSLEFLGLVAVGAGCIGIGRPAICNSANLCYTRKLYNALAPEGFNGDAASDEHMLQLVSKKNLGRAVYNADPASYVVASPASNAAQFWSQRQRWAQGAGSITDPLIVGISAVIFIFFLSLLAASIGLVFGISSPAAVLAGWALKISGEAIVLGSAAIHYGRMSLLRWFVPAQLLHIPYVMTAVISGLAGGYTWKGR